MVMIFGGVLFTSTIALSSDIKYSETSKDKPYQVPTLDGLKPDFYQFEASYKASKPIDSKEVFNIVMSCFPSASNFDVDIDFKVGVKSFTSDTTGQDKFYGGIVAKMPIYSTQENARVREQEYKRRQEISKLTASLISQVTKRNLALRMISLYKSLERREQLRIAGGVERKKGALVTVDDQVKYLEKLAKEHQKKYEADSEIDSVRLQLVAHCSTSKADDVDLYLRDVITGIDL